MRGKSFAIKQAKRLASRYFPDLEKLTKHNLNKIAIDPEKVAKDLRIKVIYHDFSDDVSGLFLREGSDLYIGVNNGHAEERKGFTIAHEIGHYLLHSSDIFHYDHLPPDSPRTVLYRENSKSGPNEVEANAFAAELLMPEVLIKKCVDLEVLEISTLARVFRVSENAMRYRLTNLGLI